MLVHSLPVKSRREKVGHDAMDTFVIQVDLIYEVTYTIRHRPTQGGSTRSRNCFFVVVVFDFQTLIIVLFVCLFVCFCFFFYFILFYLFIYFLQTRPQID